MEKIEMKVELVKSGVRIEEEGHAMLTELTTDHPQLYIQLVSYDEDKSHPYFETLRGKKLKITIEEIP